MEKNKVKRKYLNRSTSEINPFYNIDEEIVLKLNLKNNFYKNNQSIKPIKSIIVDKKNNNNISIKLLKMNSNNKINNLYKSEKSIDNSSLSENIDKEFTSINDISKSIKNLQTIVPDLLEKIKDENPSKLFSLRFTNRQYEKYLYKLLNDLNKKESKFNKNKEELENKIKEIKQKISEKQSNFDKIDIYKKYHIQKIIKHYESEFNKKEEQNLELNKINTNKYNIKSNYSFNDNCFIRQKIKQSKNKKINEYQVDHLLRIKYFKDKLNNYVLKDIKKTKIKEKDLEKEINEQKLNLKEVDDNLRQIFQKIKKIHKNKKTILDKLYIHYLNILKEGKDTRNEGLAWAICEIFSLGKKVMMSFLPKYLDEKCVLYLFQIAQLLLAIKHIEKKRKKSKRIFNIKIKPKTQYAIITDDIDKRKYFNSIKTLNNLKKKFCRSSTSATNITNNSKEKIMRTKLHSSSLRKRKFAPIDDNSKIKDDLKYSSLSFINANLNDCNINEKDNEIQNIFKDQDIDKNEMTKYDFIKINQNDIVEEYSLLNKKIEKLKEIKEKLKNKEMSRIFKEFYRNQYCERYNVDKNTLLSALIGEDNIMNEIEIQNKKEKIIEGKYLKTRLGKKDKNENKIFLNKSCLNLGNNLYLN